MLGAGAGAYLTFVLLITVFYADNSKETFSQPVDSQQECTTLFQTFYLATRFDPYYRGANVESDCLVVASGGIEAKRVPFVPLDGEENPHG